MEFQTFERPQQPKKSMLLFSVIMPFQMIKSFLNFPFWAIWNEDRPSLVVFVWSYVDCKWTRLMSFLKLQKKKTIDWWCLCEPQVARKLAMVEADLERAEERAETGET